MRSVILWHVDGCNDFLDNVVMVLAHSLERLRFCRSIPFDVLTVDMVISLLATTGLSV